MPLEYYIFPTIVSMPLGYDCTIPHPFEQIGRRIDSAGETTVSVAWRAFREGAVFLSHSESLTFRDGALMGDPPEHFTVPDQADAGAAYPAFLELLVQVEDERPVFRSKAVLGLYSIFTKPGKKSFFSDNAYKYGAPPVISQMAQFGQFIDGYPVIHIDRERDLGETLVFINPYKRPVVVEVRTYDGRALPRTRVPAESARNLNLDCLLRRGAAAWSGHVQLTANNRLITFNLKHSYENPQVISDAEHLDPYRSDPTFLPSTRAFRLRLGDMLARFSSR